MLSLFTELFQKQRELTTEFENMKVNELNKCLSKFYASVRRKDGSFNKKAGLLSLKALSFIHVLIRLCCMRH